MKPSEVSVCLWLPDLIWINISKWQKSEAILCLKNRLETLISPKFKMFLSALADNYVVFVSCEKACPWHLEACRHPSLSTWMLIHFSVFSGIKSLWGNVVLGKEHWLKTLYHCVTLYKMLSVWNLKCHTKSKQYTDKHENTVNDLFCCLNF